ncbi:hypothetical protein [Phytomonospora endophytica]|uniref:Uncharacterized protein n=1 Tax=Phytomonospora endophytica TaxID=714109 RepID=A0A841FIT1_9ACTN|nr:hypothetical protein [Phytomonospora endophytica]MBB6037241.1 hypothetical protein [Phytomonospora endophytica]GIG71259.1 hypothetical protein Pen01_75540 [Phytomonospora endophytica]
MRKNWPHFIGYATAAASLIYGGLGLLWAFGGPGYPFGTGDPDMVEEGSAAIHGNLLGLSTPEIAGPSIAAAGLAGAVVAFLMARGIGRAGVRGTLIGIAAVMAFGLTIVVQDYRPLTVVAYLPILAVGKLLFGWPEGVGLGSLLKWPSVNLTILLFLGLAWIFTAVAYARRTRGACANCGRDDVHDGHGLVKWGKPAVITAMIIPLIYCATRWLWALGFSLGIDEQWYREGQENGLWLAGAALASMGAVGALLTLGLIQRWGEVFPRWMIGLRGKRVPIMLAVVPATIVAILVISAGTMYIRMAFTMGVEDKWVTNMPETLWPVWGGALFLAALAYLQRRRGTCRVCSRA